jgi:hypothetical protein
MTKIYLAIAAVLDGFTWEHGQRFLFLREDGLVRGGGTSLKATYGPNLIPDLDDAATWAAYESWSSEQ